ncbi:MAG: type III pantothenate kinase [Oscillospiraceae bacterium]|nr:type III pantothenate kinase [Oscillospiraceae bacterium]
MILAVNVCNALTTIGLFDEHGKAVFYSSIQTSPDKTPDQCAIDFMGVFTLHHADPGAVTGAILACVVPPLAASVAEALRRLTGRRPMVVGPGIKTGLNIRSDLHNQLGADIVACSVAVTAKYPSPVLVVDMGTATTFSLLCDGVYEGCAIAAGIRLGMEALSARAAELPAIALEVPQTVLGRNTIDAMRSGVVYGGAGMVDSMIDRIEEANGVPLAAVVATGELAPLITGCCKHEMICDPDLHMDGLFLIYQKNSRKPK